MTRSVLIRLLETFFRRWWLYLLPVVVIVGFGFVTVSSSNPTYRSAGVITVNSDTLLSNLADVSIDDPFTFETPASVTSRRINDLLGSTGFAVSVAEQAGLSQSMATGIVLLADVRSQVRAAPVGDSLVSITATTEDPEMSFRLANSAIEAFIALIVENDLSQSLSAAEFYDDLSAGYRESLVEAGQTLDDYVRANPEPVVGDRPVEEQNAIARLEAAESLAQEQFATAVAKAEDARLVAEQTQLDIDQRIGIVDAPEMPLAAEPRLRRMLLSIMLFVAIGTIVLAAMVAIATALDRSVRDRDDIESRFEPPVLGLIPIERLRATRHRGRRRLRI